MNYAELKAYINDELATTFDATTYTRWTDIVNGWLRRDQVNNNLIVQGSVTPTSNPFFLATDTIDEILDLWILDGAYQLQLTPTSTKRLRDYGGFTSIKPLYYTVLQDGQVEVQPYAGTGYTFYYTAVQVDTAMSGDSDQSTALLFQPGLVLAAYKRCAYRYNKDPEGVAEAENDYLQEVAAYRVSETMKSAGTSAVGSGAWSWD